MNGNIIEQTICMDERQEKEKYVEERRTITHSLEVVRILVGVSWDIEGRLLLQNQY